MEAKDQPSTKDRKAYAELRATNIELRTTLDDSHIICKNPISNQVVIVKLTWNPYLEDFIR